MRHEGSGVSWYPWTASLGRKRGARCIWYFLRSALYFSFWLSLVWCFYISTIGNRIYVVLDAIWLLQDHQWIINHKIHNRVRAKIKNNSFVSNSPSCFIRIRSVTINCWKSKSEISPKVSIRVLQPLNFYVTQKMQMLKGLLGEVVIRK